MLEEQTTETEIARREAERELIRAQVAAQTTQMQGSAEAAVMQAKGYTQKNVLQADVQKAFAEGIVNMGPVIGGSGGGSSVMGDTPGLGVGMAAMNAIAPQMASEMQSIPRTCHSLHSPHPYRHQQNAPSAAMICHTPL